MPMADLSEHAQFIHVDDNHNFLKMTMLPFHTELLKEET